MTPLRIFLIVLTLAVLLGRLGPFGTFSDLRPVQLYAYWIGLTLLLWLQIEAARLLFRNVPRVAERSWPLRAALAGLAGAVPSAFEVAWAESLLRVERDLGPMDVAMIYGDVLLIAVPLALVLEVVRRRAAPRRGIATPDEMPGELDGELDRAGGERLLASLPPERRGRLLAFAAEDHYLRVFTDRGEALILHRFGDALRDVSAHDGLRVHRGWWVARSAVERAELEGDRIMLRLTNGVCAPVSRTYRLAVREAGLLGD